MEHGQHSSLSASWLWVRHAHPPTGLPRSSPSPPGWAEPPNYEPKRTHLFLLGLVRYLVTAGRKHYAVHWACSPLSTSDLASTTLRIWTPRIPITRLECDSVLRQLLNLQGLHIPPTPLSLCEVPKLLSHRGQHTHHWPYVAIKYQKYDLSTCRNGFYTCISLT